MSDTDITKKKHKKHKSSKQSNDKKNDDFKHKKGKSNKKKRTADEIELTPEEIEAHKREKSRKKWKKRDEKEKDKFVEIKEKRVNDPIQFQTTEDQHSYFWKWYQSVPDMKDLTELEINERKPPLDCFEKPEDENWELKDLHKIVCQLERTHKFVSKPADDEPFGSPMVLILTRSAVRCTELVKELMPFRPHAHIGTLFAKHKKIEDQTKFLNGYHCRIAVGTPGRVLALAQNGSLKMDEMKHLIIDMDRDVKTLSVLELMDTNKDLYKFYQDYVHPRAIKGQIKLSFF